MRSGLAIKPTTNGSFSDSKIRRQRYIRHQRHIRGLHAAVGEIDRGRRLRSTRHPDEHNVCLFEVVGVLSVIVQHGVVQRIDAFEIFGVEQVLRADPMRALAAEIGLEELQHRIEDRKKRQPERAAFLFERVGELAIEQCVEYDARRFIELIQDTVELLAGAHQRVDVLDWRHIGVLRRSGARDREQRLSGCVGDEMQMEKISGPVRQSLKTCGRSGSRPRLQAPCKRSPPYLCQSVHIAAFGTPPAALSHDDLDKRPVHRPEFQSSHKPLKRLMDLSRSAFTGRVCTLRG